MTMAAFFFDLTYMYITTIMINKINIKQKSSCRIDNILNLVIFNC